MNKLERAGGVAFELKGWMEETIRVMEKGKYDWIDPKDEYLRAFNYLVTRLQEELEGED